MISLQKNFNYHSEQQKNRIYYEWKSKLGLLFSVVFQNVYRPRQKPDSVEFDLLTNSESRSSFNYFHFEKSPDFRVSLIRGRQKNRSENVIFKRKLKKFYFFILNGLVCSNFISSWKRKIFKEEEGKQNSPALFPLFWVIPIREFNIAGQAERVFPIYRLNIWQVVWIILKCKMNTSVCWSFLR